MSLHASSQTAHGHHLKWLFLLSTVQFVHYIGQPTSFNFQELKLSGRLTDVCRDVCCVGLATLALALS